VQQQLSNATKQFTEVVLGPLGRMNLEPMVTDMQTTDSRLLARYRLAGDWQLAAFTPRPRAPRDSVISLQVHQSAINNTLEQLVPRDQAASIADIARNGLQRFGGADASLPVDISEDVMIQFATTRPITVEVDDGQLWLTLRIVSLTRGEQLNLSKFIVRAAYQPVINGLDAKLVRTGALRISGPRMSMRERLPARAIFNTVLAEENTIPITLPQLAEHPAATDLQISQLELRDGWIGLALGQAQKQPRIATRP